MSRWYEHKIPPPVIDLAIGVLMWVLARAVPSAQLWPVDAPPYADHVLAIELSRTLGRPDRGVMVIRGQRAPVVGRVCMDQTMVDVTDIPGVKMGDEVTVFGPDGGDTADTIAVKTQTINYEVVCGLARRVPRVYKENGKICEIWNNLEET